MKPCPHCGASLHEEASFCPYCARAVNERKAIHPPRHMPRRALYSALIVFAAAATVLLLVFWFHSRPRTYDSKDSEVIYSNSFRLCFAKEDTPIEPVPQNHYYAELDASYRYPVQLYISDMENGAFATEDFMQLVESITAEINSSDEYLSITCTEPQEDSGYYPDAAVVIFVDFSIVTPGEHEAELVCTVTMKNGDVIRLHQDQQYSSVMTYRYTSQDAPMNTIQELQALVDEVSATVNERDQVYLYLPPIVYEGELTLRDRTISLYGSVGADGQRTTFTGTVQASYRRGVHVFDNIYFIGHGEGVGVHAVDAARIQLVNCRVSGWETGMQAADSAWVDADETGFEDNAVGLHFDTVNAFVSDNFYTNDVFQNNGTAILVESVPGDTSLEFPGALFKGNGQDIDNRCGQKLELEGAIFK